MIDHRHAAVELTLPELVGRARRIIAPGSRRLLAIAGPPGAGKSTLAAALVGRLPARSVVLVPQDGYHLANPVLAELGLSDRKGAPETFDAEGFYALLKRLRSNADRVVYAPEFHREIESSIAASIRVPQDTPLVIVEGNYLLLDTGPWAAMRSLFDEAWYLDIADSARKLRLITRHRQFGRSLEDAERWTLGNDEHNAAVVRRSATRADLVVSAAGL